MRRPEALSPDMDQRSNFTRLEDFVDNMQLPTEDAQVVTDQLLRAGARIRTRYKEAGNHFTGEFIINVDESTKVLDGKFDTVSSAEWDVSDTVLRLETENGEPTITLQQVKQLLIPEGESISDEKLCNLLQKSQRIHAIDRPRKIVVQQGQTEHIFFDEVEILSFRDKYNIVAKGPKWVVEPKELSE